MITDHRKRLMTTVVFGLAAIAAAMYFMNKQQPACGYSLKSTSPILNLEEIIEKTRQNLPLPQQFNTAGFVQYKGECPPCPKGAQCKPCGPNHVILGPNPDEVTSDADILGDQQVIVYTKNPEPLRLKNRYLFTVSNSAISPSGLVQMDYIECAMSP